MSVSGRGYNLEDKDSGMWTTRDTSSRKKFGVPYDITNLNLICAHDEKTGEFTHKKNRVASMVTNSEEVIDSHYEVNLKYAVAGRRKERDSALATGYDVPHCYQLCTKTWTNAEVLQIQDLIKKNYGYRMFLDDLPSATFINNKTLYDTHIPLGGMTKKNWISAIREDNIKDIETSIRS